MCLHNMTYDLTPVWSRSGCVRPTLPHCCLYSSYLGHNTGLNPDGLILGVRKHKDERQKWYYLLYLVGEQGFA